MSEYLLRDAAPLCAETWAQVDGMVVTVLKHNLVGRRVLPMLGPLGWGVEQAPVFGFEQSDGAAVVSDKVAYVPLETLDREFVLKAKQMAMAKASPFGLDLGAVAIAASELAHAEDEFILKGLMGASKASSALGDWGALGGPFKVIAMACAQFRATGFDAPYALVVNPSLYARLASLMGDGRREIELVEHLVCGGILQSPAMPEDKALLLSPQAWNMELVVGQDAVTAYVGNQGMDHRFRIFETLALRIKRAEGICVLG
jgi:uncharacterized linocin/CFP29 family protein